MAVPGRPISRRSRRDAQRWHRRIPTTRRPLQSPAPAATPKAPAKAVPAGFSFPFDPLRVTAKTVRVWALLVHPRQGVLLQRERHADRGWRTVASLHANRYGVLNALVLQRGAVRLRLQSGGLISAVAVVPTRPSRL